MAIQAILGLGALGSVISELVKAAIDFFFTKAAKRLAIILLVVTALYAATNTLLSFLSGIAASVMTGAPAEVAAIGMALPSNTVSCLSVLVSVEVACLTWSLTVKALEFQAKAVS
ncbi:DUF5455 family protein [Paraglaciecola marina]|uniref:DUF5455 family protein n=1 Tax=Paraglaciecola marina TaxID=2500157 RepID=UPI00105F215D|nr:DUF5455 family protein [Paraglaciecola marina]